MTATPQGPTPWYLTRKAAIWGLVIVGPLALPMVWWSPQFSARAKWGITALTLVLTVVMWRLSEWSLRLMGEQLKLISG